MATAGNEVAARSPRRRGLALVAASVVVTGGIAALLVWRLWPAPPPPGPAPAVSRFVITPPATAPLANLLGNDLAISPDGKRLAYLARDPEKGGIKLYVRDLDRLDARAVPGSEITRPPPLGDINPFFSPDGRWIGFKSPGQGVIRVSLNGEPPLKIVDDPSPGFGGGTWAPDDTLIYSSGYALQRVSARGGGTPKQLTPSTQKQNTLQAAPVLLPGGHAVLFDLPNLGTQAESVAVLDLETGKRKILIENGAQASYAATGHIVFVRGTTLMAVVRSGPACGHGRSSGVTPGDPPHRRELGGGLCAFRYWDARLRAWSSPGRHHERARLGRSGRPRRRASRERSHREPARPAVVPRRPTVGLDNGPASRW